jgi:hypothetical protein
VGNQPASVEPRYELFNSSQDVVTFIFDRNGMRRHMKKGQIAMVAVKAEGLRLEAEARDSRMIRDLPQIRSNASNSLRIIEIESFSHFKCYG